MTSGDLLNLSELQSPGQNKRRRNVSLPGGPWSDLRGRRGRWRVGGRSPLPILCPQRWPCHTGPGVGVGRMREMGFSEVSSGSFDVRDCIRGAGGPETLGAEPAQERLRKRPQQLAPDHVSAGGTSPAQSSKSGEGPRLLGRHLPLVSQAHPSQWGSACRGQADRPGAALWPSGLRA